MNDIFNNHEYSNDEEPINFKKDLEINDKWIDFWKDEIGVNLIPFDTEKRKPILKSFKEFLDNQIPESQYQQWKEDGKFENGFCIVCGKVWKGKHAGHYLIGIDIDKELGIKEFCSRNGKEITLEELSNITIVEQHKDDSKRAHIYFYSPFPFPSKTADSIIGLEIKGERMLITPTPNIHHKNGYHHEFIGNKIEPAVLSHQQANDLIRHIDTICSKYDLKYLDKSSNKLSSKIRKMIKSLTIDYEIVINKGERHPVLLSIADSLLITHYHSKNEERKKDIDEIQHFFFKIDEELCKPEPLPQQETECIWKSAIDFTENNKDKYKIYDNETRKSSNHANIDNSNGDRKSVAENLINLIEDNNNIQFFKDQFNIAHTIVRIDNYYEVLPIEGNRFRRYLSKLYYESFDNKIANVEAINNVINILQAKAEFEGKTIHLHLRVAWSTNKDALYYDLTDEKRRCIKITKTNGWKIIDNQFEVLFSRYNHHIPQVEPTHDYQEKIFDKFIDSLNIKNEKHKLLIKVYLITLLIPDISHPILLPHGEKGSAKSTLQKKIKLIIDPSILELLTINNDKTEFIQQLSHNWLAFYDNVRYEPKWLSDEACKASTGIASSKRKLYTDDEDKLYNYKRCLSFSGINVIFTEPDILDRSIKIELERIDDKINISEEKIFADLKQQLPQLLGYIFDTLSKAMQVKDIINLDRLPRMADFALWGEAIARAMGYKPLEFLNAYYENIGDSNIEVVESDSFADTIIKIFNSYEDEICWISSPKIFIKKLKEYGEQNDIDTSKFPKTANSLTKRLKKIKSNLREGLGIEVIIERITSGKGNKKLLNTTLIKIRKSSPVSPVSPVEKNDEGKITKNAGDIKQTGVIISSNNSLSPNDNEQNFPPIYSKEIDNSEDDRDKKDKLCSSVLEQPSSLSIEGFFSLNYLEPDQRIKIEEHVSNGKTLKCHHKNCGDKEYSSLYEYNIHCHNSHPKSQLHPELSLIKALGLEVRGNPWE